MLNGKKENSTLLKLGQPILANGLEALEMVMENKHGQMELAMKVIGKIIELMAKESLFILMEISMKATG